MTDQIEKVKPAGVNRLANIADTSSVARPPSGRVTASTLKAITASSAAGTARCLIGSSFSDRISRLPFRPCGSPAALLNPSQVRYVPAPWLLPVGSSFPPWSSSQDRLPRRHPAVPLRPVCRPVPAGQPARELVPAKPEVSRPRSGRNHQAAIAARSERCLLAAPGGCRDHGSAVPLLLSPDLPLRRAGGSQLTSRPAARRLAGRYRCRAQGSNRRACWLPAAAAALRSAAASSSSAPGPRWYS